VIFVDPVTFARGAAAGQWCGSCGVLAHMRTIRGGFCSTACKRDAHEQARKLAEIRRALREQYSTEAEFAAALAVAFTGADDDNNR